MSAVGMIVVICLAGVALWLLSRRPTAQRVPDLLPSTTTTGPESSDSTAIELSFGPSPDKPLIRFTPYSIETLNSDARPLDLKSANIAQLNPVLQMLPTLVTGAEFSRGNYMKVIVDGSLAPSGDGQSFFPYVRNIRGRISKLARLKDAQALREVISGAMVFQLVSVLVAQKHLADISKKLDEIKKGVDDIKTFLVSERKSVITGAMKYLEQAVHAVMQGEFPDAVRHELERIERDLIGIQDHLVEELRTHADEANKIRSDEWFGTGTRHTDIKNYQDKLYKIQQEWLLCVRARAACWQVLSVFPGDQKLKVARKEAILRSTEVVCDADQLHGNIAEVLNRRIDGLNSDWNAESTISERKADLGKDFARWQEQIQLAIEIQQETHENSERLLSYQKPMVLALKVENGVVIEAFEVPSEAY